MKKPTSRTAWRLGIGAVALGLAFSGVAVAAPANASTNSVTAPTATSVICTPLTTASVSTVAQFSSAYANSLISCINMTEDINFDGSDAAHTFTGSNTALTRSLSIDGGGKTLTFGLYGAGGNRPFYLQNLSKVDAGIAFQIHNATVNYPYTHYLISGPGENAKGWDVTLDGLTFDGIPGVGVGSPNGRIVSGYQANVFLTGKGNAANMYDSIFPRNLISEPGSDWKFSEGTYGAAAGYPPIDLAYGTVYGGGTTGTNGNVYVNGTLSATGTAYSAIRGFAGVYVGSDATLNATDTSSGTSYGALTTAANYNGSNIWVSSNGNLNVSSPQSIGILGYGGTPLDMRSDPGASVKITGGVNSPGFGAIMLYNSGSRLNFNQPAVLDIKNTAEGTSNNAIAGTVPYTLTINNEKQLATWNSATSYLNNPDNTYENATLLTDEKNKALAGTTPANLVADWNTANYRRIFSASSDVYNLPLINPAVGIGMLAACLLVGAGIVKLRRRSITATEAV